MSIPGYTAEAALYQTAQHYCMTRITFSANNTLHPTNGRSFVLPAVCPAVCRTFCLLCKMECLDLIGAAKGQCLRECELCGP